MDLNAEPPKQIVNELLSSDSARGFFLLPVVLFQLPIILQFFSSCPFFSPSHFQKKILEDPEFGLDQPSYNPLFFLSTRSSICSSDGPASCPLAVHGSFELLSFCTMASLTLFVFVALFALSSGLCMDPGTDCDGYAANGFCNPGAVSCNTSPIANCADNVTLITLCPDCYATCICSFPFPHSFSPRHLFCSSELLLVRW